MPTKPKHSAKMLLSVLDVLLAQPFKSCGSVDVSPGPPPLHVF